MTVEPTQPVPPKPGPMRPGIANVRLVCPPEVMDAAVQLLADMFGEAWQPSTRKPGRHAGGDVLQYGTLIIPVPRSTT